VIHISVRTLAGSEQIEIDTPNVALSLLRAGTYRVEVNDVGDSTVVKVSEGAAEATGPSQNVVIHAQQVVTFSGIEPLVAQFSTLGSPDEFDSWSLERDRRDDRAATSRTAEYVSPDVTGYEDLDDNGTWSSEAEYGYVWTPRYVAADWAPYRYGRWVSISPWGWTWIDDARWGYAPFHYGRWAHVRNRWCWVPGPRHVRAVYAPAHVGWVGSPGAYVSWFPLGPREVYVPGRHFSRRYAERVNLSNTVVHRSHVSRAVESKIKDSIYRNRSVPGGVTAVPRSAFTSASRTVDHRVRFSEQELARSQASAVAPQIAPGRASRVGDTVRANVRVPPRNIVDRQVVVRRDPPASVARYARSPYQRVDLGQTPVRTARPPVRGPVNDRPDRISGAETAIRNANDRPPRAERPTNDSPQPAHSSVFEPRAIAERVRVDRDRQSRVGQQQREAAQQREAFQQREAEPAQRQQRQDDQARQHREMQQQLRERLQRQQAVERQPAAPQREQRERPAQRERNAEPRVERPRVERPQVEQTSRPEAQRPAESRPQPRSKQDGNTRSKRD
ncbi:MAG TPA: DUF6600 domain-containing protein, partial [Steroidobacteraceae bacterium]|nr:DUF6600 domain-containing protein [Steroidobacteraceae bacterium]